MDIKRSEWIALKDRVPDDDLICLISDGDEVTLAASDVEGGKVRWRGLGFSGYEWDWDFTPTHWIAFTASLPESSE